MFAVNDRNLAICTIMVLVVVFTVFGKSPTEAADIVEKAIIAIGSLATGSIARDSQKVADLTKKLLKKEKDPETSIPKV